LATRVTREIGDAVTTGGLASRGAVFTAAVVLDAAILFAGFFFAFDVVILFAGLLFAAAGLVRFTDVARARREADFFERPADAERVERPRFAPARFFAALPPDFLRDFLARVAMVRSPRNRW